MSVTHDADVQMTINAMTAVPGSLKMVCMALESIAALRERANAESVLYC